MFCRKSHNPTAQSEEIPQYPPIWDLLSHVKTKHAPDTQSVDFAQFSPFAAPVGVVDVLVDDVVVVGDNDRAIVVTTSALVDMEIFLQVPESQSEDRHSLL